MYQELDEARHVSISRDDRNVARELHHHQPVVSEGRTPQLAATDYLARYGDLLGIEAGETGNLALMHERAIGESGNELRFLSEKQVFDMNTVTYQQTLYGLPVWNSGVSVHMKAGPYRIVSSHSSRHSDLEVTKPSATVTARVSRLTTTALAKALGLTAKDKFYDLKSLRIDAVKLIVYRYEAEKRIIVPAAHEDSLQSHEMPELKLPAVQGVEERKHYIAGEVHFALAQKGQPPIHWIAIVGAESMSVLYLRTFSDDANGMVFAVDPITTNGGPLPSANNAALNPIRTTVALPGLVAPSGGQQPLVGDKIRLQDVELPTVASPTEPTGTDFNFNARTDNFSAVNAYYHCDRFFRLMESLGFNLATFFGSGTTFPTVVDHRGLGGNVINAHCVGTSGGLGIQQTTFALADTGDVANPIGIACDYRVVLHELGGHGVLYPHVHSPNFGFSHSAGDSVAVITNDPGSVAQDRFVSFPWVNIGRRHDRTPAAGWGWGGNIALHPFTAVDGGGYNNEQILSTTLFRFYQSIGGDAAELATKQFAARYAVYLILRAISTLTPATNPSNAAGFATALMNADLGDWVSEGQAGGAYGKVIRWAFEKQGLYQPAGAVFPNNNVGAPPPVDVYIDDGRAGEYTYQPNHWSNHSIWNRRHNDGLTTHEEPVVGTTNFAYVKIRNRGTQAATGVVVKAFHAKPAAGLVYPNDWQPMATAQLAAPNVAPNSSAEITVGPFEWVPSQIGHECMFMVVSATGDPSNISHIAAGDSIPEWRLVPNDNNIGQRNVFPVAGGGGLKGLLKDLDGLKIVIKNPHAMAARVTVNVHWPRFLAASKWTMTFANPGAGAFALKPGEATTIVLKPVAGKEFAAADVKKALDARDATIHVTAVSNGIVVGGMSYELTV